ncbi:exonuclease domain-containing protein [Winkia sp. UMB10116]|uniref:exonuclease domain-containing protein n=1 Tax=Winkia sp. UMB10116 TaxID=3046355 RepID=UPI0025521CEC|nr:exonuclease domain-containing protein [Winkia sp. UMB10116]MDK6240038.1 exonuclease domain-containing protein [Winkia sp. UMB10116]
MDSQQVWQHTPLVGFDTETTGTDPRSERILSASLVLRNSPSAREDQHVRSWLIDPGVEIPAASTAVHGMSTEYVRANGTDPVDTLPQIANALVQAVNDGAVIVIFNAPYDLTILESELARHGLATLRDLLEGKTVPVFDPLVLDRAFVPRRRGKRRLSDLLSHYDVELPEGLHDAFVDASATLDLVAAMLQKHAQFDEILPGQINELQRRAHAIWAEDFEGFLRGRRGSDVHIDRAWPLVEGMGQW